jgi:hypothetical protein
MRGKGREKGGRWGTLYHVLCKQARAGILTSAFQPENPHPFMLKKQGELLRWRDVERLR